MTTQTSNLSSLPKTFVLTAFALIGFAANSLLCRMTLKAELLDAASFTGIRLASGAIVLALLARFSTHYSSKKRSGTWVGALALFSYASLFSFAYLRLSTGMGALVLFGAVQLTMIAWGVWQGERPSYTGWFGIFLACGGFVLLSVPGISSPDIIGVVLMAFSGFSWGVYSLLGRRVSVPLLATTGNFIRSIPFVFILLIVFSYQRDIRYLEGVLLAIISGSLASGIAYSLWYAALQGLSATSGAIIQLLVPILATLGGVVILYETITLRSGLAGLLTLLGIAFVVFSRRSQKVDR